VAGGCYENGTLIWHNRWVGSSAIECREALALPADPRRAVLLRRIDARGSPTRPLITERDVSITLRLRITFGPYAVRFALN
jgi:hypothetical protein